MELETHNLGNIIPQTYGNYMTFRYTILFQLSNHLKTTREVKYDGVDTLIGRAIQEPVTFHPFLGTFGPKLFT